MSTIEYVPSYAITSYGRMDLSDYLSRTPSTSKLTLYINERDVSRCDEIVNKLVTASSLESLNVYINFGSMDHTSCLSSIEDLFNRYLITLRRLSLTYYIERLSKGEISFETRSTLYERAGQNGELKGAESFLSLVDSISKDNPLLSSNEAFVSGESISNEAASSISIVEATHPKIVSLGSRLPSSPLRITSPPPKRGRGIARGKGKTGARGKGKTRARLTQMDYGSGSSLPTTVKKGGCFRIVTNEELKTIFSAPMKEYKTIIGSTSYGGERAENVLLHDIRIRHKLDKWSAQSVLNTINDDTSVYARLTTPEIRMRTSITDYPAPQEQWRTCHYRLMNGKGDTLRDDIVLFFE